MCRTRAAAPGSSIIKMGRMGSDGQCVSMIRLEGLHRSFAVGRSGTSTIWDPSTSSTSSNASHQATGIASRQESSWEK